MTKFQVGDKVRLDGEVIQVDGGVIRLKHNSSWYVAEDFALVERPKPRLKVGDVLEFNFAYLDAPVGTVVVDFLGAPAVKVKGGSWRLAKHDQLLLSSEIYDRREVVYVPRQ